MEKNEAILAVSLERGVFDNEEQKVSGIAQRAVDKGYDSLSVGQKMVVKPWLSSHCTGTTDPGGYHNDCSVELNDDDLVEALEQADDVECIQCESCRNEEFDYARQYSKLMAE